MLAANHESQPMRQVSDTSYLAVVAMGLLWTVTDDKGVKRHSSFSSD